ncbi:MAG: hypothetical protein WD690_06235 [Vicinamibacterales bacterium]
MLLLDVGLAFQAKPPAFLHVTTVEVKPSMVVEYERYASQIADGAVKIGLPQQVSAYQVVLGASPYTYVYVAPLMSWADPEAFMTGPQIVDKAFGAAGARMTQAGRASVAATDIGIHRFRPDLSTNFSLPAESPAFASLVRTQLVQAEVGAYEESILKLKAAQEQTPSHPPVLRFSSVVGPANFHTSLQFFNRFSERDTWPSTTGILGGMVGAEEARRVIERGNRAISHREYWVLRSRRDLSRGRRGG